MASLPILRLIAGLAVLTGPVAPAFAQGKVDADMAKYCRAKHDNSFPERQGTRHFCNQRGTRQPVDLAEACRLTTGSPRYEVSGYRVLCLRGPAGTPKSGTRAETDADVAKFCRTRFPGSVPERIGTRHFCNQRGTRQPVDLADACRLTTGSPRYRIAGYRVLCRGGAGSTTVGTYRWPTTGQVYRGPLKNGRPHGIGRNYGGRGGAGGPQSIGRYVDGRPVGPFLVRIGGRLTCILIRNGSFGGRLPAARCAHLR